MNERQNLVAERAAVLIEGNKLQDILKVREWTPEESAKVDEIVGKIADLDSRIANLETMVVEEEGSEPPQDTTLQRDLVSRVANLEKALHGPFASNRRTAPAPVGAPAFVRDLDDRKIGRAHV